MEQAELKRWIDLSLQNENFKSCAVDFTGTSGKTDGYLGDIAFVKVNCVTKDGQKVVVNLVIKSGKREEIVRNNLNVHAVFKQEILLYEKVIPAFRKFQVEKGIKEVINFVPRCYKSFLSNETEVIVLEDLKSLGFELNDRQSPFNFFQLKAILEKYGQFHAISFALRDQRKSEYEDLTKDLVDSLSNHLKAAFRVTTNLLLIKIKKIFKERKEIDLYEKLTTFEKDPVGEILNLFKVETSYSVVLHGDPWNSNYLFKYDGSDKSAPAKVAIIDWQLSSVKNSPIFDIMQFLYCCCSVDDLVNWETYLKIYYDSLSKALLQAGSDPMKVFPYSALKDHWYKYSIFGITFTPLVLQMLYVEEDQVLEFESINNATEFAESFANINLRNEKYYERLIGTYRFFFDHHYGKNA